ncbi:hypothetical protein COCNU_14G009600 [Cocos nucifera]|uniref:Uncharacterized protein n=1 Tax=Cocos nucifera TaxID=13894 RepID=A0A8K0IVI2_COCNU|nr:hypothetical protein COCNU_14G009600 [Cocos nucifera]
MSRPSASFGTLTLSVPPDRQSPPLRPKPYPSPLSLPIADLPLPLSPDRRYLPRPRRSRVDSPESHSHAFGVSSFVTVAVAPDLTDQVLSCLDVDDLMILSCTLLRIDRVLISSGVEIAIAVRGQSFIVCAAAHDRSFIIRVAAHGRSFIVHAIV